MAYSSELDVDVRLLWLRAFVLWLEHEPVLDKERSGAGSGGAQAPQDLGRRQRSVWDGEGQNRTGDTTIFSRVLYQLSYLAARR